MAGSSVSSPVEAVDEYFDMLIKSRFIELFGHQDLNEKCFGMSTIGESCIIRDSERIPITSAEREPGPYPYYGANGLQDYVENFIFDGEFVLMAEDGGYFDDISRPNCYYVSGKIWVNNHAHILQPKDCLNVHYLDWSLKYRDLTPVINGTTRAKLTQSSMRTIPILIPPIELQNEFELFIRHVNQSKEICKQIFQSFDNLVKSRFIEMFEGIHASEWPIRSLSESCVESDDIKCGPFGTQLSKNDYISDGVAIWGIPEINSGLMKKPTQYISEEKARKLAAFEIRSGDIVMSRKGNVGQCSVFPNSYPTGILHSDAIRIRINPDLMNPTFLMFELHFSQYVRSQIMAVSLGAIMPGINVSKLKGMNVYVPPLSLQDEFVRFVQQVDKSKFEVVQSLRKLVDSRTRGQ